MEPKTVTLSEKKPSLEEAQKFVGGYVEIVMLPGGRQMLVNEEGLLMNLTINAEASYIARRTIVGDALILEGKALWD